MSRDTPTVHLTARMKEQAAKYASRTGDTMEEALRLARTGMLTLDGKRKATSGPAKKAKEHLTVTADERERFKRRGEAAASVRLLRDETGYYVATGAVQSRRYASPGRIPMSVVEDVAGTR